MFLTRKVVPTHEDDDSLRHCKIKAFRHRLAELSSYFFMNALKKLSLDNTPSCQS